MGTGHSAHRGKWAQLGHTVVIGESGHRSHSAHRGKWVQLGHRGKWAQLGHTVVIGESGQGHTVSL